MTRDAGDGFLPDVIEDRAFLSGETVERMMREQGLRDGRLRWVSEMAGRAIGTKPVRLVG